MTNQPTITHRADFNADGQPCSIIGRAASVIHFGHGVLMIGLSDRHQEYHIHTADLPRIRAVGAAMGVPAAAVDAVCAYLVGVGE